MADTADVVRTTPYAPTSVPENERPFGHDRTRLTLSALFAASLLVYAAGSAGHADPVRAAGLAGALFFGVGTAPLQLSGRARLDLRLGVAGVVGMSVLLIVASVMALTPWWHPVLAAAVIGAAAAAVHAWACARVLSRQSLSELFGLPWSRPSVRVWRGSGASIACIACIAAGNVLWCASAVRLGHIVPGALGFLPNISVFWYVGLACVVAGIVLARGRSEWHAACGVLSLLAALTVTPGIVYGMPRLQWSAKHIQLVQTVLQAHFLNRGAGIYDAYSGFFSGMAWLCELAGIHDPTGIATYWQFIIGVLAVVGLRLFFGRLTTSPYRIWVAIALVILVNSVHEDYFSPQSVGFALSMGVYGLAVGSPRLGRRALGRRGLGRRALDERELDQRELGRGGLGPRWPGLDERARIILLVLAGCALAVTHELSPYIVGGVLVVLVIFRTIRPWYVPATILLPAIGWALLNRNDLSGFISLSDMWHLSNFEVPQTPVMPGMERVPAIAESSDALALGLVVLTVLASIGFVRTIRDRSAWAFMISAGVGLGLVSINAYGNEGIYRAALFAIPWLAAMSIRAVAPGPRRWVGHTYAAAAMLLLTGTYLVAQFGLDNADVIRTGDFQALRTYETIAAPNSFLLALSAGSLPMSLNLSDLSPRSLAWPALIKPATALARSPDAADISSLASSYARYAQEIGGATHELYAIWSPASVAWSVDYGQETLGQAEAWRNLMIASPDWRVVYVGQGTYLFRDVVTADKPVARAARHEHKPHGRRPRRGRYDHVELGQPCIYRGLRMSSCAALE
jgi:hypothetical protein